MRQVHDPGFTLVELLMVVAMLGILLAIAIPGLLRARQAGNEAGAIGSLRAITSAQYMYASTCAEGYFAPTLPALGTAPANGSPFIGPDLGYAATVTKSGYAVTIGSSSGASPHSPLACNGTAAGTNTAGFFAIATPSAGTGTRAFGVNTLGTIYFAQQMAPLAMTDTTSPAGARPIPE